MQSYVSFIHSQASWFIVAAYKSPNKRIMFLVGAGRKYYGNVNSVFLRTVEGYSFKSKVSSMIKLVRENKKKKFSVKPRVLTAHLFFFRCVFRQCFLSLFSSQQAARRVSLCGKLPLARRLPEE